MKFKFILAEVQQKILSTIGNITMSLEQEIERLCHFTIGQIPNRSLMSSFGLSLDVWREKLSKPTKLPIQQSIA